MLKRSFNPSLRAGVLVVVACFLGACDRPAQTADATKSPATSSTDSPSSAMNPPPSATVSGDSARTVSASDKKFMVEAAQAGYAEVTASRLAEQHAQDPGVKSFAQQMVTDHTKAAEKLKTLAASKGVKLPENDAGSYQSSIDKLQKLNGHDFDKAYADEVGVKAHHDAVALFDSASGSAQDADVKAFATTTLPTLKEHMAMADKLAATVGAQASSR